MSKTRLKNFNLKFFTLFILLLCLFCFFLPANTCFAASDDIVYSNVLDDLKKNETFDEAEYKVILDDYSLNVIQIAEGVNNELFVYVYQPSADAKDIFATSINISTAINDSLYYVNYKLKFLNSSGVFYKYLVESFDFKSDKLRYYQISSIFRSWREDLDPRSSSSFEEEIEEVPFEVAQLWSVCTIDDKVYYNCTKTDVIEIVDKHVGYIRYTGGFILYEKSCDSHYIAFSTDKPIENLIEADVYFTTKTFQTKGGFGGGMLMSVSTDDDKYEFGPEVEQTKTLVYTDVAEVHPGIFHNKSYSWDRIDSVDDFESGLKEQDITLSNETLNELKNKQWVLRFFETDYTFKQEQFVPAPAFSEKGTRVTGVTILRLKFETSGEIHNLGVIDNKQTPSIIPDNHQNYIAPWFRTLLTVSFWVLMFAILIPLFPVLGQLIVWLVKGLFYILKYVFIALWFLITLPFKIFKKDK